MKKNNSKGNLNQKKIFLEIALLVCLTLLNATTLYVLFSITRYATLSKSIFTIINIIVLVMLLMLNAIAMFSLYKRNAKFSTGIIVLSTILSVVFLYVGWATTKVNQNIDKMVVSGNKVTEEFGVAFVTYNNTLILEEDDIEDSVFGIIGNEEFLEGNTLAKAELSAKNIEVKEFIEYDNYNDLFLGLVAGEVDVVAMPKNYSDLFSTTEGYEEFLEETSTIYEFTEVVEVKNDYNTELDVTTDPFNILVMGNDGGRTDALIVLSVNPTTMELAMTSIPRDSYVPIMCYTGNARDKITHARTVSRQCTIDTVENFLDIDINFFIETNFQGVVEIVDALGGIQIDSPVEFTGQNSSDIRGTYNVHIFKGVQIVDGEGALAFARERHHMPNGDYDRTENQQQVITAMIKKAISIRDVNKLLNVLEAAGDNIKTNMSVSQMTQIFNYLLKVIDSTYVSNERLIKVDSLSISGYSAYYYNESAQLPLWISIPWNGAVNDAQNFLKSFLTKAKDKELSVPSNFEYSITNYYDTEPIVADFYNEVKEKIDMPDYMPTMTYNMTLSEVKAWCTSRGIPLTVNYIKAGDSGYSDDYANGTIISQSVRYGILVKNIKSLTVSAIQKVDEEDLIPDFVGKSYASFNTWVSNNGYKATVNWISSTDSNYNSSLAGTVATQSILSGEMKADYSAITVSVYDYPDVTASFKNASSTKNSIDDWAAQNMLYGKDSVTYKYVYSAIENEGTVKSWSVVNITGNTSDTKTIKTNSKLTVIVYTKDTANANKYVVTFVGLNGQIIQTYSDVVEGSSVTPPIAPEIEGYTFSGWDSKKYEAVNEDVTITAKYTKNAEAEPTPTPTPETTPTVESTPDSNGENSEV